MDTPINQANRFSTLADDCAAAGKFSEAIEAHFAAAAKYLEAITDNTDPGAAKTLKMLAASNQKKAKELQRRLDIMKKKTQPESASASPSPPTAPSPSREIASPIKTTTAPGTPQSLKQKEKEQGTPSPDPSSHTPRDKAVAASPKVYVKEDGHDVIEGEFSDDEEVEHLQLQDRSGDSDIESSDSFHRFWDALEKLVQKLPTGVAFAMAHQAQTDPAIISRDFANPVSNSILLDSYYLVPPSEAEVNKRLVADLQKENAQLREQIAALSKNDSLQQMMKENDFLKSSIISFKQEIETQARKYNVTQMKGSTLNASHAAGRTPHHLAKSEMALAPTVKHGTPDALDRLKQLELENQRLRTENANLNDKVKEYRERWRKLKESAKKRMDGQLKSSQTQSNVAPSGSAPEGNPESVFYSVAN